MKNRVIAMLLTALLCLGIICTFIPSATAAAFTDIPDEATAEAAEVLRLLGIVDGTGGGAFRPGAPLTRASFCKMALEAAGRGKEALAQKNRVVFPDVTASHWALGYVNAASSAPSKDEAPLIRGRGDGKFWPDANITYGESVTILMRMLGYADSDVGAGAMWFDGYLAKADEIDLTDGITRSGSDAITRGEAARLFEQLLFTDLKDSTTVFLTKLEGSVKEDAVILSTNTTASDGTSGAVKTSLGTFKTERSSFSAGLEGMRGELALDKSGKLLAVHPNQNDTLRYVSVVSCDADHVTITDNEKISTDLDTVVWDSDGSSTYEDEWMGLYAGSSLVICYNGSGQIDYFFIGGSSDNESAIVARSASFTSNPFSSLVNGAVGYNMYKNGVLASVSDLRQYDVGTYNKAANTIYVSDSRLTGAYEGAYPNTTAPSSITMMGKEFSLLPGAVKDLQSFKIGDSVTLLLTQDLKVAGVVSSSNIRAEAVGIVQMSGTSASVTLLGGRITLTGNTSFSSTDASHIDGQLVNVSYAERGYLYLSRITGSSFTGSFDVTTKTVGTKKLAGNVKIYEKVGSGPMSEISFDDLTVSKVPSTKVTYAGVDYAGRINYLVLDDATGDRYNYGYFVYTPDVDGTSIDDPGIGATVAIRNANSSGSAVTSTPIACGTLPVGSRPGGLVVTANGKLANYVILKLESNLHRNAFDLDNETITTSSTVYPIWDNVQCYNTTTNKWFVPGSEGLAKAVAFSDNLTIYFDRAPEDGGKVRLITVS